MTQIDIEELEGARALFEAYYAGVGGIAYNGEAIPGWHNIAERARYGWVCAYRAAVRRLVRGTPNDLD